MIEDEHKMAHSIYSQLVKLVIIAANAGVERLWRD